VNDEQAPPQIPKNLTNASPEELAAFGLQKDVAWLCDELHHAIEEGLDRNALHNIVGLWEANRSEMTFESLVEWGRPCACDDCRADVTPYDEEGRLIEGASEWYMVEVAVWNSARSPDGPAQYLSASLVSKRASDDRCGQTISQISGSTNRPGSTLLACRPS
jgi:hypothetical protein